jgi:phosphoenolpyruvate carboxykinase (GTP)
MNPYLEALQAKLSAADFKKLSAIDNPNVHEFIAKESDLCHPEKIFICSDSAEDIAMSVNRRLPQAKKKQP